MSNYTPYYEGGWKNEEEMTTTPICAEALNHMEEGISAAYDIDPGESVPSSVRIAIYTLLSKAAYIETGLADEVAVVQAWAAEVTSITVSPATASVSSTSLTAQLSAVTTPAGKTVTWASSNTAVATVSSTGLVTAVGNGTATITATSGTVSASCAVTVTGFSTLTGIEATYTQSGTVYDTASLDDLKDDLVVTASYDDSSTETLTDYTLSGTLSVGTSTITVTYGGFTDTFTVTVSEIGPPSDYTAHDYLAYKGGTGTRGIITPAQIKSEYTIEFDMYIPTQSGAYGAVSSVFGTRIGTGGTKEFAIFVTGSSGKIGYWYNGTDTTTNITTTKDTVHHFKILPVGSSEDYPLYAVIDIDGTEYSTGSTASGVTWSAWFGIMGYGTSASAVNSSGSTYYQLGDIVVKDANGNTVYWFMPVSKGTQVGFYEIIGQAFYEADSAVYQTGDWTQ